MKTSQAKLEAIERYNKANTTTICIRLNKNTDSDVIEALEKSENKSGYIKELIRRDLGE